MTTLVANSSPAGDFPSTCPGHSATPIASGRSDASSHVAHRQRDAVALTWDLTIHQLHQAFSQCMAAASTDILDAADSQELARTRLAAARHAVDEIQAALRRMACGTYGRCQQCDGNIAAERLQASPTARWCAACQA